MRQFGLGIVCCFCCIIAGCTAAPGPGIVPSRIDHIILYSLECDFDWDDVSEDQELLHGYVVLGSVKIDDDDRISEIADAIRNDIATGTNAAACFDPHHAIRMFAGNSTTDIVICYHCTNFEATKNGKLVTMSYPMNVNSRDVLNRVLRSSGVKLSPGATSQL